MKFEHTEVFNIEGAIRGMRNPLNSWDKSDSYYETEIDPFTTDECRLGEIIIGEKDLDLAQRLIKGGSEHRKFMRQIFVSVDITAPLYWWKEMSTYKIGTTANSTSTMHKLAATPITIDCFEMDDCDIDFYSTRLDEHSILNRACFIIETCELLRQKYLETKDKRYWKELIRLLPESWLQTRTWTANYEVVRNIVHQRQGHRLSEWQSFIDWAHTLPYAEELIFYEG